MPIEILMPALSPTMTDGTLAKWLKKEGDTVSSGDMIAEIETDKATMEVEAVEEGILGKILVPDGTEGVAVNAPIALLLEEGEDASVLKTYTPKVTSGAAPKPAPAAPQPAPAAAPQRAQSQPVSAPAPQTGARVAASPLAKRMAKDSGMDIAAIAGSGPHGRIVKRDVESALAGGAPRAAIGGVPAVADGQRYIEVPNTTMRKTIARRLQESKQTVPHFYLSIDCNIDKLMEMRKNLNDAAPKDGDGSYKLSVNDIVIKAVAAALRQVPAANASWTEAATRFYQDVDISVAVATPGGLITPIIRHADAKGLADISHEMRDLAIRARDAALAPEEYTGGGFTISNLGMYGVREFAAIINPPQSCILAVGAGEQRPVVRNGALAIANVMTCTLSVDHRSVDGSVGAEFMAAFKRIIEEPLTMLL